MVEAAAPKTLQWLPLDAIGFPQLYFQMISGKQSGMLHLADDRQRLLLVFYRGAPVYANSSAAEDQLGAILLASGKIQTNQLETAQQQAKSENKRLGTVLVALGFLDSQNLLQAVREQLRQILLKTFSLEGWHYAFEAQELGQRDTISLEATPVDLLVEGVQRHYSLKRILRDGLQLTKVLKDNPRASDLFENVRWNEAILKLLPLVDGKRTIQQIVDASGLESIEAMKAVFSLVTVNRVFCEVGVAVPPSAPTPAPVAANAGSGPRLITPEETVAVPADLATELFSSSEKLEAKPQTSSVMAAFNQAQAESDAQTISFDAPTPAPEILPSAAPAAVPKGPVILGDVQVMQATYEEKKKAPAPAPAAQSEGEITLDPEDAEKRLKATAAAVKPAPKPEAKLESKPAVPARQAPAPPTAPKTAVITPSAEEVIKEADISRSSGTALRFARFAGSVLIAAVLVLGALGVYVYLDPLKAARWVERVRFLKMYDRPSLDAKRLGQFYLDDGQLLLAEQAFEAALKSTPEDERIGLSLADVYLRLADADRDQRLEKAKMLLEKITLKNPASSQGHLLLGQVLLRRGEADRARESLSRYLSQTPASPEADAVRKLVEHLMPPQTMPATAVDQPAR